MSFTSDLKVLYHLVFTHGHGDNLAERMDDFYSRQVDEYDNFRARLLLGRTEMMQRVPAEEGAIWVDLGGGTGA
ncbi:MAG: SAM-dependent methyltransferase, partial [Planctomycetia bacterium]|nr:SAM-dependent methyltransferase [Planctomycetia bacterium]